MHGGTKLKRFMKELNIFLPNVKFTLESSKKRVDFLDLKVSLENGSIRTDHTKNSIIFSQKNQIKHGDKKRKDGLETRAVFS